jgi:hypothetical protein
MAVWYTPRTPLERFLTEECAFDLVKTRWVRYRGVWSLHRELPDGHRLWQFRWPHKDRPPTLLEAIELVAAESIPVHEWRWPEGAEAS